MKVSAPSRPQLQALGPWRARLLPPPRKKLKTDTKIKVVHDTVNTILSRRCKVMVHSFPMNCILRSKHAPRRVIREDTGCLIVKTVKLCSPPPCAELFWATQRFGGLEEAPPSDRTCAQSNCCYVILCASNVASETVKPQPSTIIQIRPSTMEPFPTFLGTVRAASLTKCHVSESHSTAANTVFLPSSTLLRRCIQAL